MESYKRPWKMSKGEIFIPTLGDNAQLKSKLCQNILEKLYSKTLYLFIYLGKERAQIGQRERERESSSRPECRA